MHVNVHCDCNHIVRSLALPHIRHATLHVLLHFHTNVMLCCTFSCTSTTHTSCYAAARSFVLPHMRHAMLLHVLLDFHTYVMLRARTACYADGYTAWTGASKQQVPEKRLKWQNVAHNRGEFCEALGQKAHKKAFFFGRNTDFRQTVGQKNWKYLYAGVWRKSVKGNVLNIFVIETLDEQNSCFVLVKH